MVDLFTLLNFSWVAQAVYVATRLGVPDRLDVAPQTLDELAGAVGVPADRLAPLMRSLAAFGLLKVDEAGRYGLTTRAADLVQARGSWVRHYVLIWGEQLYPALGRLEEMVRTGSPAFELAFGAPVWEHYRRDAGAAARFVDYMDAATAMAAPAVVKAIEPQRYRHVVDVGASRGVLLAAMLKAAPGLRGTWLDQPQLESAARARLDAEGVLARCTLAPGSFLEKVPAGADLYTIRHVLHDWPDADAARILRNVRAAMAPEATLAVIEGVLDEAPRADSVLKMRALEQFAWTGGRVRSAGEFHELLGSAGLEIVETRRSEVMDATLLLARPLPR